MPVGVLNSSEIAEIAESVLKYDSPIHLGLSPADSAVDVPLGDYMYEMRGSRRPGAHESVLDIIKIYKKHEKQPLDADGTRLEPGHVYLIKLAWEVVLPKGLCIRATAKSSIGRLDTLVRLVADNQPEFDRVSDGGRGPLYVEVAPLTFPILVKPGLKLSQLRFMRGNEEWCTVPHGALVEPFEDPPVLQTQRGSQVSHGDPAGVLLSLNLQVDEDTGCVGFCAKRDVQDAIDPSLKNHYDPREFWDPVAQAGDSVTIKQDHFYIFRSNERFAVPGHLAVDCQAYSDGLGDIRIHYAGFAHPYFGVGHPRGGAPLIFEVRGHSVDTILKDKDALAKVFFRRMSKTADSSGQASAYSTQELTLSKCFKPWVTGQT